MKEERHQKILDRLSDGEYVSVETLSRELFVSMPTIRRDLTAMQQMGLVMRTHGGVIRTAGIDAHTQAKTTIWERMKRKLS